MGELTSEIGIRKAVGAKSNDILVPFLIEAITLSAAGGLTGILAGFDASSLLTSLLGWPTIISPFWVAVSFGSSAAIGIFFGLYPAYKAAQLDPLRLCATSKSAK